MLSINQIFTEKRESGDTGRGVMVGIPVGMALRGGAAAALGGDAEQVGIQTAKGAVTGGIVGGIIGRKKDSKFTLIPPKK